MAGEGKITLYATGFGPGVGHWAGLWRCPLERSWLYDRLGMRPLSQPSTIGPTNLSKLEIGAAYRDLEGFGPLGPFGPFDVEDGGSYTLNVATGVLEAHEAPLLIIGIPIIEEVRYDSGPAVDYLMEVVERSLRDRGKD